MDLGSYIVANDVGNLKKKLESGNINVNNRDHKNRTLLHIAAGGSHEASLSVLLHQVFFDVTSCIIVIKLTMNQYLATRRSQLERR